MDRGELFSRRIAESLTTRLNLLHSVINIDVLIDDPMAYTKPWSVKLSWKLVPDTDLIESICEENSKDLPHMVGK